MSRLQYSYASWRRVLNSFGVVGEPFNTSRHMIADAARTCPGAPGSPRLKIQLLGTCEAAL